MPNYTKISSPREKIDSGYILKSLLRRWYVFVFTLAMALVIAHLYLLFTPKTYRLKATLLLDDSPQTATAMRASDAVETTTGFINVADEIGLLTSFGAIRETVEQLNFQISYHITTLFLTKEEYNDLPFRVEVDATQRQLVNVPIYIKLIDKQLYRLKVHGKDVPVFDLTTDRPVDVIPEVNIDKVLRVGQPYKERNLNFTVKFLKTPDIYNTEGCFFIINSLAEQASDYQKRLQVQPISDHSRLLEVSIKGSVPQKEADFLNTLLAVHLQHDVEKQNHRNRELITFIDQQLGITPHSTDGAVADGSAGKAGEAAATHRRTASRAVSIAERGRLRNQLQRYEVLLQNLKNTEEEISAPSTLSDLALQNQVSQYNRLFQERAQVQLEEESTARVSKLNAQIQKTRISLIEYTSSLVNQVRQQLVALNGGTVKADLNPPNRLGPALPALRRQLNLDEHLYRNIYDYLLTRRAEAGIALATNTTTKTVVDAARPNNNELIYPDRVQIYLIALLLGFLLPLGLLVTRRFLRNRIAHQADIELHTAIPTLGVVGYNDKAGNYLVAYSSKSALAESFRSLRVNLQYLFLDTGKKVIGITSSQQGEGKTFCASNLSVVMAQSGKKTLLIDTDLRKPRIAARFDMDNMLGLATYLTGMHGLEEVIQTTETENLHVITSGPSPASPLNLLGSPRMEALLHKVRQEYDYIILDTPPLGIVSDFLVLMDYTDFNIFIIRHKLTERTGLNRINELYNTNRLKNVGILINGVRSMSAYGYSDKTYKYGYRD